MSLQFWLRRLMSLFEGSSGRVTCNLCKTAVPPSHVKKGLAVMIAQRTYCKGCVAEITERKPATGAWPLAGADAHSSSTIHLP